MIFKAPSVSVVPHVSTKNNFMAQRWRMVLLCIIWSVESDRYTDSGQSEWLLHMAEWPWCAIHCMIRFENTVISSVRLYRFNSPISMHPCHDPFLTPRMQPMPYITWFQASRPLDSCAPTITGCGSFRPPPNAFAMVSNPSTIRP